MSVQGLKIPVIAAVFITVLGLAFFTESFVYGRQVTKPLAAELRAVPGVRGVVVEGRGARTTVSLHLEDDVELVVLYPTVQGIVGRYLGSQDIQPRIVDERDEGLTRLYYELRFEIEEALATGYFTRMAAAVRDMVEEAGLRDYRLYMDSDNVYVQLHRGSAYLYEVIPRRHENGSRGDGTGR